MPRRILMASSEVTFLRDCRASLMALGFEVESAITGLECLEKIRNLNCQLLVLDAELFWGSGLGVIDLIEHENEIPPLPIILIVSENALPSPSRDNDWIREIIHKPASPEVVHGAVCRVCPTGNRSL